MTSPKQALAPNPHPHSCNCHTYTLHNTSHVTCDGCDGIHGMKGTLTITCHLIRWAHVTCTDFKFRCANQDYPNSPMVLNPNAM